MGGRGEPADGARDAQLYRRQLKGTYYSFVVAIRACMHGAVEDTPYDHIAVSHNFRTRIYIAEHTHVARVLHRLSGAQAAPQEEARAGLGHGEGVRGRWTM